MSVVAAVALAWLGLGLVVGLGLGRMMSLGRPSTDQHALGHRSPDEEAGAAA
jgi:hypothetical protein